MDAVPLSRRLEWIALRPDLTRADLERACSLARQQLWWAVCVGGSRVQLAASLLEDSPVHVAALVGFPFGQADPDTKRFEAEAAIDAGAAELDVVLNLGWIKDRDEKRLLRELRDIRDIAEDRPVKAVIEWPLLDDDDLRLAARVVLDAEVQFLVNATGCAVRPATPGDVRRLREWVGPDLGLKAVGGVQARHHAEALVAAGANRVGLLQPGLPDDEDDPAPANLDAPAPG
ncbi:MAG: deoxyribose-phosphate aldolase [Verrucomicrobiae bacterium]|nr:deoxyribose-phosphate aldolase [Verrucomicrobiae bacterium]